MLNEYWLVHVYSYILSPHIVDTVVCSTLLCKCLFMVMFFSRVELSVRMKLGMYQCYNFEIATSICAIINLVQNNKGLLQT